MAAPLRSENPELSQSVQFAHFGVLNTGAQSRTSTVTSLVVNLTVALVVIIITAASAKLSVQRNKLLTEVVVPIAQKKIEPVKPKIIPPKLKPLDIARIEPPKITVPKLPDMPQQPIVKMDQPKPILTPPAPQRVIAPAAPVAISLAHPQAASVPNHDQHPTAVRMGASDSPLNNLHGPAVAPVNMGRGMPGMNAANTGNGPAATRVNMGNGSPGSTSTRGHGVVAVAGIPHGVPGGTGRGREAGGEEVSLGHTPPPPQSHAVANPESRPGRPPRVISKPKPEYTAEAIRLRVEGTVTVRIRVQSNGAVEVLGITSGLGHGLDESARRAVLATRFEPATDSSGHPVAWDGVVNVAFQLAG